MSIVNFVGPIPTILTWLCYIVLLFYVGRIALFMWSDVHRSREVIALAYVVVAVYVIYKATHSIKPFTQNVVQGVGLLGTSVSGPVLSMFNIAAAFVFAAFICNFSRSLWMLKSLDHGIFESIPDWETLSQPRRKRISECTARMLAAFLFITLEFELKRIATTSGTQEVSELAGGAIPARDLSVAGQLGVGLYLSLIVWWCLGLWITKHSSTKIPRQLILFYFAGLINSMFLYFFGGVIDQVSAVSMLMVICIVLASAVYMLGVVLADLYAWVRSMWRRDSNSLYASTVNS